MIYAYVCVNSENQNWENQLHIIKKYESINNIVVDKWIIEKIPNKIPLHKRKLGQLLKTVKKGDIIIVTQTSILTSNLKELYIILKTLIKKDVNMISVEENYHF